MSMYGIAVEVPGGCELRFERRFAQPIERVWAALTESSEISSWFFPGTIEPRLGGVVDLLLSDGATRIASEVTAWEPPRLLEYGFHTAGRAGHSIRWELTPDEGGTRLVFTHRLPAEDDRPRNLAGWHGRLANLGRDGSRVIFASNWAADCSSGCGPRSDIKDYVVIVPGAATGSGPNR